MAARVLLQSIALAVAVTSVTGCESSPDLRSNTPRITVNDRSDISEYLMTESNVQAIDGLANVEAGDFNEIPAFENPNPRGPCGAVVPSASFPSDVVGRRFTNSAVSMIQLIGTAGAEQDEELAALQSDRRDGCADYQSTTNQGLVQTVRDVEFADIDDVGAPLIAWTSTVEVGAQVIHAGLISFRSGPYIVYITVQSWSEIGSSTLIEIAEVAISQLAGSG